MNEHEQWKKKKIIQVNDEHRQTNRLYQPKSKLNVMLDGFFDIDTFLMRT